MGTGVVAAQEFSAAEPPWDQFAETGTRSPGVWIGPSTQKWVRTEQSQPLRLSLTEDSVRKRAQKRVLAACAAKRTYTYKCER